MMIKAWATVDETDLKNVWKVDVYGKEPHNYHKVYTIRAKSDNDAAHEGLRRFVEQIDTFKLKDRYTCH